MLTNHYMGKTRTYASKQVNIPNIVIARWMFNLEEILKIVTTEGYNLVFKSTNFQAHNFDVPAEYKDVYSCNLLFKKIIS